MRTFEYKLRPNKSQIKEIERILWETKCLYNTALEQLITHYKETGKHLNRFAQDKYFNKQTFPDLPAVVVDATLSRLHRSFANFFRGLQDGKKVGFPRYKSHQRWSSFQFRDYSSGGKIIDGYWRLSKTVRVKVIQHRQYEGRPKFTRLIKRADGYYVQIICETPEVPEIQLDINRSVGIDVGLKYFIADSRGIKIVAPKFFRESERKLAMQQRQLSKKTKGSANRAKVRKLVAKTHLAISRQRRDFLHKLSRRYANENDIVCMESLNITGLIKNKHLAKSISDASWSTFQLLLSYKLQTLGKKLILVNPAYTSQICSQCGAVVRKSLSQRTHYCPECLCIEDRDVNASKNILAKGMEDAFRESIPFGISMN